LLGNDQPFYGLQAVGLDGKVPRHTSIEQMAEHYMREVRAFQPQGPYYLAGYSMGGLIAFEMAQQLWRFGERVAFLGLLDTFPKSAPWMVYVRTLAPYLRRRWQFHLQRWRSASGGDKFRSVAESWKGLSWWLDKNVQKGQRPAGATATTKSAQAATNDSGSTLDLPSAGSEDYYWSIASGFRLRRYPGSIDVFLSDNANPVLYRLWGNLAGGGATLHRLDGSHLQIMFSSEHLPKLVQALQAALDRARQ
jgi:thioesterase domain-containing protein